MHWSILKLEAPGIMRKMSSWAKVAGRLEESIAERESIAWHYQKKETNFRNQK